MTSIRRILPFLAILLTLATSPLAATNFELDIRELDRQPASSSAPKHPTSAKQPKKAIKPEPPVKAPSAKSSSRQETTKPKQKPERSVISVHGATQCERAASLLGQLGIMFSKGEEIPVGREGSGLSFKTDLLFSADGRRHAVICTRQDEGGYTLIRIAEMQGLHIIRLETDRFLLMGDKILSALGLQYTTTTEQVKTRKGKRTATGFLVTSKGKEIFVAGE